MRRGEYEEPDRNYSHSCSCLEHSAATFYILKFVFRIEMALACLVCTTNLFWQLLPKGEDLPFGKESIFLFQKNHPLSEDTKFKLLLCMSWVFGASWNVSFNDDNHILKFLTEGFENLPSSFFNPENLLSSIEQCTWQLHLYFPFRLGSFI